MEVELLVNLDDILSGRALPRWLRSYQFLAAGGGIDVRSLWCWWLEWPVNMELNGSMPWWGCGIADGCWPTPAAEVDVEVALPRRPLCRRTGVELQLRVRRISTGELRQLVLPPPPPLLASWAGVHLVVGVLGCESIAGLVGVPGVDFVTAVKETPRFPNAPEP